MKTKGLFIGCGLALLLIFIGYEFKPRTEISTPAITLDDIKNPPKFTPSDNPLADLKKSELIQRSQKSFRVDRLDATEKLTNIVYWESPDRLRTTYEIQQGYEDVQIGHTHYRKEAGSQWTQTNERSIPECPGINFLVESATSARYVGKSTRDFFEVYGYEVAEPKNPAQSDAPEQAIIWISVKDGLPRRVQVNVNHLSHTLLYLYYNENLAVRPPNRY